MPAVISAFPFPLPSLERKLAVEGALRKAGALYWNWTHPDNPNLRSSPSFSSSLQRSLSLSLSSYPPLLSFSLSSAIEFTAFANPFRVADHPALKLVAGQREKSPGEMPCFKPVALIISFIREICEIYSPSTRNLPFSAPSHRLITRINIPVFLDNDRGRRKKEDRRGFDLRARSGTKLTRGRR